MYKERMLNYYPPAVRSIKEFKAIVDGESTEIEQFADSRENVLNDAYLLTMGEERIKTWERVFGLTYDKKATLQDRRETIIARIRAKGKLNTESILAIVNSFTGGTATAEIKNDTLTVKIQPPPGNKSFRFESVENELLKKLPCHLRLNVIRDYQTWGTVNEKMNDWSDLKFYYQTWEDVLINNKILLGVLDETPLEEFILDLSKE